ncbi:hypothetical protein ETR14_14920 [Sphingosinicella sp. BN140058]|nr:hypothetical protein ETR14_14920 [Sphingosinicella sp. BN140058]
MRCRHRSQRHRSRPRPRPPRRHPPRVSAHRRCRAPDFPRSGCPATYRACSPPRRAGHSPRRWGRCFPCLRIRPGGRVRRPSGRWR